MSSETLLTIDNVLHLGVLPWLRGKDLLRLRLVCKQARNVVDKHIRKDGSGLVVCLNVAFQTTLRHLPLSQFLDEEETETDMPRRIPASAFEIIWPRAEWWLRDDVSSALLRQFRKNYGQQVTSLKLTSMCLPLTMVEILFFEALPNLKMLSVGCILVNMDKMESSLCFPSIFKELEQLQVGYFAQQNDQQTSGVILSQKDQLPLQLKMLGVCEKLQFYSPTTGTDPEIINDVFKNQKSKLKVYEMTGNKFSFKEDEDTYKDMCRVSVTEQLKLMNASSEFLCGLKTPSLELVAPQVCSVQYNVHDPCPDVKFENVKKIGLTWSSDSCRDEFEMDQCDANAKQLLKLAPSTLPNLKRVDLRLKFNDAYSHVQGIAFLWSLWRLPGLEEVSFSFIQLSDAIFLGTGVDPPILQAKSLVKLDLGDIWENNDCFLSDATFVNAFSQMRLREFRMEAFLPLEKITSVGIRALLAGPFRETIEIFPFKGWSLFNLPEGEFKQLGRAFSIDNFPL